METRETESIRSVSGKSAVESLREPEARIRDLEAEITRLRSALTKTPCLCAEETCGRCKALVAPAPAEVTEKE